MLSAGDAAPEFQLPGLSSDTLSLSGAARSGPVLLAFFKVSCPVCQYTFPFLERIAGSDRLQIYGISQDDTKATNEFRREYELSFPMYLDSGERGYPVSNAYRITHVPSLFLVEGDRITVSVSGFSRQDLKLIGERYGLTPFRPGEKTPDFRPG